MSPGPGSAANTRYNYIIGGRLMLMQNTCVFFWFLHLFNLIFILNGFAAIVSSLRRKNYAKWFSGILAG